MLPRIRFAFAVLSSLLPIAAADSARAQTTTRASVDSAGGEGARRSLHASISPDGRIVGFHSESASLVPDDTNRGPDVFVRDRRTSETSRVSVDSAGVQGGDTGDWWGAGPSMSAEGRHVAFHSAAADLVAGDTNRAGDVFVRDRETGTTSRVSVNSAGVEANTGAFRPSISADARFVAFSSRSDNLVPGDTNGSTDVFVHDRQTGQTSRVSVDSAGIQGNGSSDEPSISADGRFVAFSSEASNLVPGDTNLEWDIFVHDRQTGATSRVSVDSAGNEGSLYSLLPSISGDGRFVAFGSHADGLVPNDTNGRFDVFVHDRQTNATSRVSVDSGGSERIGSSIAPSISADGRYVAFASDGDFTASDVNGAFDVFRHDRFTGDTVCVSVDAAGTPGNGGCEYPSISADGRLVAFTSHASNLVPGDTNDRADVFVHETSGCNAGAVNGGVGDVTDVLFVNDSAGGPARTLRLLTYQPLTVFIAAPPSATAFAPFVLYAWSAVPPPGAVPFSLPYSIGDICLPTPLTGGSPAPLAIWNNTRSLLPGAPTRPSSPAPSLVVRLPVGLGRPASVFLQGIIRDAGAPNGRAAVTNGVAIEIR